VLSGLRLRCSCGRLCEQVIFVIDEMLWLLWLVLVARLSSSQLVF
jgi:hypothetical protein